MSLPDVGLGGPPERRGRHRGHEEEVAPPYRGQRVVLGPQSGGAQEGATDRANKGGHELSLADGATVGDDAGATIPVDGGPTTEGHNQLPEAVVDGDRMSAGERLLVAFRFWLTQAGKTFSDFLKSPGGIYHIQPESLAQHDERVSRKTWVPEGYEGKLLGPLGVAYQQSFGKFGIATGYAWAWLWKTPIAFIPTAIGTFVLIIWIRFS
jgi:hypothetical protein